MQVRLQKFLAEAGVASRRQAEQWIVAGRVDVNGRTVQELGTKVDPVADTVLVDGRRVRARRKLYLALNKPVGYVCSRSAQSSGQRLVGDLLPAEWSNVFPIGRLDRDTEGLLLLTNDGELCLRLTHPRYAVPKRYVATVTGKVDTAMAGRLCAGVRHEGERLAARRARIVSANASHSVVELELTEGRHHEVRRLFAALGFTVERLQRLQVGSVKLGELRSGRWRVLQSTEVAALFAASNPPAPGVDKTGRESSIT